MKIYGTKRLENGIRKIRKKEENCIEAKTEKLTTARIVLDKRL